MTVSGQPTAADTFVLGSIEYTLVSELTAAVAATATLTSDETQPDAGDTVTVGDQTYTFVTALTAVYGGVRSYIPNEVLIGADADETLENLVAAINNDGVAGTNYSLGTELNPLVSAAAVSAHATVMTARSTGTDGNAIAKAEDSDHLDWDGSGAVFTGGVDTVANEILIGGSAAVTLDNIKDAVNGTGDGETTGAGFTYSVGTVANTQATATTNAATTQDFEAVTAGTPGNAVVFTEDMGNTTISGSGTLGGTTLGASTKGKYTFTDRGTAHRFVTTIGDLVGTGTVAVALYNEDDVLIKTLQATQAQSGAADTAYEVEISPGDYILCTASAVVASTDYVHLSVR